MAEQSYKEIDHGVLNALEPPPLVYYIALGFLGLGITLFAAAWLYQVKTGMGVAGISHPTGWGVYIANFVYWVGIAHSGTLISAILYLVRARFRDAISRSAEAMTIFAIAIAGLFPLVHLGRLWVFYYILPYPSERQIWPNFISPLLWDVMAIFTYFTVSVIFFYVGLIPDLAAAREYFGKIKGERHPRTRLYRALSLGWHGAASQWRHYGRSYLFFAALATPLVISVHSIVSWDFAMSLLPGWHTTLFAPYFVSGAIHSGLAMVLVLLIPLRRLVHLERFIRIHHFERVAQTMLVTTAILGYSYIVLPFMAWYSGNIYEQQLELWRATGYWAWAYWGIIVLNVLVPVTLAFRALRRNLRWLFVVGIVVVIGMWIERVFLVPSPLMHDFLPHNWGWYVPTWVEITITAGSFSLFFFLFTAFSKALPTIPLSDVKTATAEQQLHERGIEFHELTPLPPPGKHTRILTAEYDNSERLLEGVDRLLDTGKSIREVYSPARIAALLEKLGYTNSPVRWWTLGGALLGTASGFALTLYAALRNALIVGGKHPVSIIPYIIIAFELTVLFGSIANLIAFFYYARLQRLQRPAGYDSRFTRDRFGITAACNAEETGAVRELLAGTGAVEIRERSVEGTPL